MSRPYVHKLLRFFAVSAAAWLGIRYVLPIAVPFLLGAALALAAEPAVRFGTGRLKLPRVLCAGVCVTATLVLLLSLVVILGSLLLRQLMRFAEAAPDLEQTVLQGLTSLEDLLLTLAYRAPEGVRTLLTKSVLGLFGSGNQMVEQLAQRIPALATSFLSHVPGSALTLFTAVLSAFMLSARLPKLRAWWNARPLPERLTKLKPAFQKVRHALGGWLKAQAKLSGLSFLILLVGFLVLGVSYGPAWALVIALIDAVPLLGTGTVLLPWALVCFLRGESLRGFALVGIYAATALTRSALEPKLVGRQLGLDPLLTLAALYTGYQLWGIGGMLLAPVLSVAVRELAAEPPPA